MGNALKTMAREVYQECSQSVAKIQVCWSEPSDVWHDYGSAFVWDIDRRLMMTCYHVIHGARHISATFVDSPLTPYRAEVVFSDPNRDLALLDVVDAPKDKLKPIIAGSSNSVRVDDKVLVIACPFGRDNLHSHGHVSGAPRKVQVPDRVINEIRYPAYQIQSALPIDAAVNPGGSGGVVIDKSSGEVIGMVNCIISPTCGTSTGVGFAIPMEIIKEFIEEGLRSVGLRSVEDKSTNFGSDERTSMGRRRNMKRRTTDVNDLQLKRRRRPRLLELFPTRPGDISGNVIAPYLVQSEIVKLNPRDDFHNGDGVIRYIQEVVVGRSEVLNILIQLWKSGKAKMRNGDVIVCRGYCKECDKWELDVLPRDDADKFGLGRICCPSSFISNERVKKRFLRKCKKGSNLFSKPKDTDGDTIKLLWKDNRPDQLKIVDRIFDQLDRYGVVKKPILANEFAPHRSKGLDVSSWPDLYHRSPTNGPPGQAGSPLTQLEELLRFCICCCNKCSIPGSSKINAETYGT